MKQRADLTFKENLSRGRHGWLRLTPAYSVKVVGEILDEHPNFHRVLEPFSRLRRPPAVDQVGGAGPRVLRELLDLRRPVLGNDGTDRKPLFGEPDRRRQDLA